MSLIEEEFEGVPISKITDAIFKMKLKEGINHLGGDITKEELPQNLIQDLIVKVHNFDITIEYKNRVIPTNSKIFEFEDKNGVKKYYKIYSNEYFNSILKLYGIAKPNFLLANKSDKDLSFDECLSLRFINYEYFKVREKIDIDYKKMFETANNIKNINIGNFFSKNFNYYFKNQKGDEIFDFSFSVQRKNIIERIKKENCQIQCYCGPHGIGKTTTFLALKKMKKDICYINLKAIFKNSDDQTIWKNQLLLIELADTFQNISNYDNFKLLIDELLLKDQIWESIICIFEFVIKKQINIQFVLDQYQEKIDKDNENIKRIINLIKGENNKEKVSLILLSSINDRDVRLSLYNFWFKIYKKLFLEYIYIDSFFNMKDIIDNDKSLSKEKLDMIASDFNYIPKYYFLIKNLNEDKLENFKNDEINHIRDKMEEFFTDNILALEDITLLISSHYQFAKDINLEKDKFEQLAKILPLKQFIIDKTNNSIYYYFPLIEDIFKSYLCEQSLKIIQRPLSEFKPSTIGEILELNLTHDLIKNKYCKFNYICKVDSIYILNKKTYSKFENINDSNILFLQSNSNAKNVDFGILNKGEDLILFQCKKALVKPPENYVKYKDIEIDKDYLTQIFETNYNIKLKRIYLLYITGISFYNESQSQKIITLGVKKDDDFKILEKICKNAKVELLFYDVIEKRIFNKADNDFTPIGDLINYIKILDYYIKTKYYENSIYDIQQRNINFYKNEIFKSALENIELFQGDFFDTQEKIILSKNNILPKYEIIGTKDNPKDIDLTAPLFIGFKRKNKKYLIFNDEKKDRKIIQISKDTIVTIKNKSLIFNDKIDKCYFIKKLE